MQSQQLDISRPIHVNTQLANDFLEVCDDDLRMMQRKTDSNKQPILCIQVPLSTGESVGNRLNTGMLMMNNNMMMYPPGWTI